MGYISLIGILGFLMYLVPDAMISPGRLASDHSNISSKCLSCHQPFSGVTDNKCIACHEISGIGADSVTGDTSLILAFHQHLEQIQCTECHTDHKGAMASLTIQNFDHSLLPQVTITECVRCHVTPPDEMHQAVNIQCGSCHNTITWSDVKDFDHDLLDTLVLSKCESCHPAPNDDYHRQLVEPCGQCHSTSRWKPSTFNHDSFFVLDDDHRVECATCHPSNDLQRYTCYGCHEHTRLEMIREHDEVNVTNIDECAACHMSADEDDIRSDQRSRRIENYIRNNNKERKKDHSNDDDD